MLRSWGTSAGGGVLLLLLGSWVVSGAGVGAPTAKEITHTKTVSVAKLEHAHPQGVRARPNVDSHAWVGSAKSGAHVNSNNHRGEKPAELLAKLDRKLDRDIAEVKKLEQSLAHLLDDDDGDQAPGFQRSPSGGGNSTPSAGQANDSQSSKPHHRHGHMRRGMELARLLVAIEREERNLARLDRRLDRQLAELREIERNLHALHHSGKIGYQAVLGPRNSQTGDRKLYAKSNGTPAKFVDHRQGGGSVSSGPPSTASARAAISAHRQGSAATGAPSSHSTSAGGSHAQSGARGVGHTIGAQHHYAASHHH